MEHANKMFLIKPEVFKKIQETGETFPDTISQLDNEMQHVLKAKIDDREKWNKYQQVLQRFLHFSNNLREPVKIPITDLPVEKEETDAISGEQETDTQPLSTNLSIEDILESIPKNLRNKSKLLLQQINKNNVIEWDKNGQMSINNKSVQGSNIIDLVNDVIRTRKPTFPKGTDIFLEALKEINTPIEYLGNETYRNYMRDQTKVRTSTPKTIHKRKSIPAKFPPFSSGYEGDVERIYSHSNKKKKKNQTIIDIDWENF